MKVIFILNLDLNVKSGLFNAIHNRMRINNKQYKCSFYNVAIVDSKPMSILKKFFGKRIYPNYISNKYEVIDEVKYKHIIYKICLRDKIYEKLNLEHLTYRRIIKQINSIESCDLVIAHWGYPHGRIAYYINKIFKKKFIVYYHGSDIHTYANCGMDKKNKIFEIMKLAKVNIFIGKSLMKQVIDMGYSGDNCISTENGIDTNVFKYKNLEKRDKVIGFVGNLERIKRAEFLPRIFEKIYQKDKEAKFIIIGDGELRHKIESECKSKEIPVIFTGRISAEKVSFYMNQFHSIILPSRNESWGCVLLEANACGAYCIATKAGGISEVVGSGGSIVENEDETIIDSISKIAIENFNKEIDRKALSERVYKYTWEYICDKEYSVISKIGEK